MTALPVAVLQAATEPARAGSHTARGVSNLCQPTVPGWDWTRLARASAILVGLGSIGTPMGRALLQLGFRRFQLIDPKRYGAASVGLQCRPEDVGRFKVDVLAEELRAGGAELQASADFLEHLEPGIGAGEAVYVESTDRLSGLRAAHEQALTMRRPLVSVHLESELLTASLRVVDYRRDALPSCALCRWSPREYAAQQTTHSCTPDDGRPTRSPRALSGMTAGMGALVVAGLFASTRVDWPDDREHIFTVLGPLHRASEVGARADCRCREGLPARPRALDAPPTEVSLAALARAAGLGGAAAAAVEVAGSGRFALRARCKTCARTVACRRWVRSLARPLGVCACGDELHVVPFATVPSLHRRDLAREWERPVAELGIASGALVELRAGARRFPFVFPAPVSAPEGALS